MISLDFIVSFTNISISSMPEILCSMTYILLVRPASQTPVCIPETFISRFPIVSVLFIERIFTFKSWTVLLIFIYCLCFHRCKGISHFLFKNFYYVLKVYFKVFLYFSMPYYLDKGLWLSQTLCILLFKVFQPGWSGVTGLHTMLSLYMGAGDSNAGPHACRANALTHWATSQPLQPPAFHRQHCWCRAC